MLNEKVTNNTDIGYGSALMQFIGQCGTTDRVFYGSNRSEWIATNRAKQVSEVSGGLEAGYGSSHPELNAKAAAH